MKILKTIAVAAGLLTAFNVDAQFQKGSILLGTDVGFNIDLKDGDDPDGYKTPYFFNIEVTGGYFLNAKNEIGLNLGTGTDRYYPDGLTVKLNNFRTAVFWRTYKSLGSKFYFSWSTGFSYFKDKYTTEDPSGPELEEEFKGFDISGRPSFVYMVHPKFGLRANVGRVRLSFTKGPDDEKWDKNLGLFFSPGFVDWGVFMLLNGSGEN